MEAKELIERLTNIHCRLSLINDSMKIFRDCDSICYEQVQSLIEILQGSIEWETNKLEKIISEVL